MAEPCLVVAVQPEVKTHYVTHKTVLEQRRENIAHYMQLVDNYGLASEHRTAGRKPGIMVFPENFIGGFGPQRTRTWDTTLELAIDIPGEETEALGKKCKEHNLYIAGANYEKPSKELPDNIYLTGFIIGPDGKLALKYRKINAGISTGVAFTTSPHDIWDKVSHDPKELFPVLETPYGNVGMMTCYDSHFPETARCLALNGAEILLLPAQDYFHTYSGIDRWRLRARGRATENVAYLVASNWAASPQSEYPYTCAHSMVVDYEGMVMEEIESDRESFCCAQIDVNALRKRRMIPSGLNYLTSLRTEAYAAVYGSKTCWEPSLLSHTKLYNYEDLWAIRGKIQKRLFKEGTLHEPNP